jgi:hypothetical protein
LKEFEDTTRSPQNSPTERLSVSPPGVTNNHRASLPDDIGQKMLEVPVSAGTSEDDNFGTIPGRNRSKSTDEKKKGFFSFLKKA